MANVEEIVSLDSDQDVSLTLKDASGFTKIDFTADVDTNGTNTINVAAEDTDAIAILGSADVDVITSSKVNDTITGFGGADTITVTDGGDVTIKMTAASDFGDVITGFAAGDGEDVLDLSASAIAPISGGAVVVTEATAIDTGTNGIFVVNADTTAADDTSMTAAEVELQSSRFYKRRRRCDLRTHECGC